MKSFMSLALDGSILQAQFRPLQVEIGWREMKNFAAALGDANPVYFDDESPEGISSPPTFPVAITWPLVSHLNDYLLEEALPEAVVATMVHFDEHLILHRLVRPGDFLSVQTDVASVASHKSGTTLSLRFRAVDQANRLIFEEISTALFRGVECQGDCGSKKDAPSVPEFPEKLREIRQKEIEVDPLFPYIYDGCTNIVFPIHTSRAFAHRVGLPDIIVQGTGTLGLAVREIVSFGANGNPKGIQSSYAQFGGMVFPGTKIRLQIFENTEDEKDTNLYFLILNEKGHQAIRNGVVRISQK